DSGAWKTSEEKKTIYSVVEILLRLKETKPRRLLTKLRFSINATYSYCRVF
ncbi:hypothetical protein BB560_004519, partial [Smittium megazygosporum]